MNELSRSRSLGEVSQHPDPDQGHGQPRSRIAWSLIGLKVAGDVLRSRRSHELMIVGAIVLAALAHQARENQAKILARLIAWDRRHVQALRHHSRPGPASAGPGNA